MKKVVILFVVFLFIVTGCGLNEVEKGAILAIDDIKDNIKYPGTFELKGDITYIEGYVLDSPAKKYYFIPFSAENKYGNKINNIAIVRNGTYVANVDDEVPTEYTASKSELTYYYTYVSDGKMIYDIINNKESISIHGEPIVIKMSKIKNELD